jgi:hypothetical protein
MLNSQQDEARKFCSKVKMSRASPHSDLSFPSPLPLQQHSSLGHGALFFCLNYLSGKIAGKEQEL